MMTNLNTQIFLFLNNFANHNDIIDYLIYFLAEYLGYFMLIVLFLYYFYLWKKNNYSVAIFKTPLLILSVAFLAWIGSQIINTFYFSERPFVVLENINVLFEHGNGDSFPSGHTTFFASLALMSFYYVSRNLFWGLFLGAVLIAFSRVISGVHWPFDILGGFVLAGIVVYIVRKIILKN